MRYIYQNKLDKGCFQHGMAFKGLASRTAFDKTLRDKAFNIAKIEKMMDIKESCFHGLQIF